MDEQNSFVLVQQIWVQVSSDYQTAMNTRTRIVTSETTVAEIMQWAATPNVLGKGDVILTVPDKNA